MAKRIGYFADGTWDHPANATNVYTLYKAALTTSSQIVFYDDGVGSDGNLIERLLGGAMGIGLYDKIKEGYRRIAHVYEEGDEVFLFGFSRGAYTARSLAGMIAACGLPAGTSSDALVNDAFDAYRDRDKRVGFKARYPLSRATIRMVGVWDTVGSLGIPSIIGGVDPIVFGFLDTKLHPDVLNAYQALAIDERRREFPPTLWQGPFAPGQNVEQVWFAGVHCDIGGGYGRPSLADISLSWMMNRAKGQNFAFNGKFVNQYERLDSKVSLDTVHDSWSPLWGISEEREIPARSIIADSAILREKSDRSYRPSNLKRNADGKLDPDYQIVGVVELGTAGADA